MTLRRFRTRKAHSCRCAQFWHRLLRLYAINSRQMGCRPWGDRGGGKRALPQPSCSAPPFFPSLLFPPASRQEPVLPAAQSLSDIHAPAPSLPSFLSPATMQPCGRLLRWGGGCHLYTISSSPIPGGGIGGACPVLINMFVMCQ